MTIGKAPSAEFEISIDGKPRSYATRRAIAIKAAEYLKRKFPNCDVVVKHLPSGEVTVATYKPDPGPR
jgi:butyrate kinase